jgi:hypothetical protein
MRSERKSNKNYTKVKQVFSFLTRWTARPSQVLGVEEARKVAAAAQMTTPLRYICVFAITIIS